MTEKQLHKQICAYLRLQYPKVMFNTDLSGLNMTIGQAKNIKTLRSNSGFPDIQILETRKADEKIIFADEIVDAFYLCGLFLEVKKETPYKKNGELKKSKHLENQNRVHIELRKRGYMVSFVWTIEDSKNMIDNYLR